MTLMRSAAPVIERVLGGLLTRSTRIPQASLSVVYQNTDRFRQGKQNVKLYRHWAEHSEWVNAAIRIRKRQVSNAEWMIGPKDPTKWHNKELAAHIAGLFERPNPTKESFRGFVEPVLEDLLVLDAGTVEKEFLLNGMVGRLWAADGGTFKVSTIWDGENPEETRYFWYPDHQLRAQLTNRELIYMMDSPATRYPRK